MTPSIKSVKLPNGVKPLRRAGRPCGRSRAASARHHRLLAFLRACAALPARVDPCLRPLAKGPWRCGSPRSRLSPARFRSRSIRVHGRSRALAGRHRRPFHGQLHRPALRDRPSGRTLGLVLVGALTTWRGHPDFVALWDSVISTLTDPIDPDFVREFQESTLAQPIPPAFLETVVQESLKVPAPVWRAALLEGLLEADFSAELRKIKAPTLIVWGDQDSLTRSRQEALTAAIAGSQLMVYPGAGHGLHWEEPERFAADLAAFTKNSSSEGRVVQEKGAIIEDSGRCPTTNKRPRPLSRFRGPQGPDAVVEA